jgi:hypothetical protein
MLTSQSQTVATMTLCRLNYSSCDVKCSGNWKCASKVLIQQYGKTDSRSEIFSSADDGYIRYENKQEILNINLSSICL